MPTLASSSKHLWMLMLLHVSVLWIASCLLQLLLVAIVVHSATATTCSEVSFSWTNSLKIWWSLSWSRNSLPVMEPNSSLLCSQKPATGPSPYSLMIHLNIFQPSMPTSPKLSLLRLTKLLYALLIFPMHATHPTHLTLLGLITLGYGKTKYSELNGRKHSPPLICSLLLHECNFQFLLSFQNIWTFPHWQSIITIITLHYYFVLHSGDETWKHSFLCVYF